MWLGGGSGTVLQGMVLLSTFWAFIVSPSSFLKWRLPSIHLSYHQQWEHTGWCYSFAHSLPVIVSVKAKQFPWSVVVDQILQARECFRAVVESVIQSPLHSLFDGPCLLV